ARILNAEAAVQQSLWNDAEESLRAAIAIDPDRPKAHIGLMNVAEGRAEQDDGGRRAQLLDEARKPAAAEMPRFEAFAQFRRRLGRLAAAQARLPGRAHDAAPGLEAAQHFEAAAALMPGDPYILENWGYLLLFQGRQANSETLLAAAIGRFRQALEVRPGYKWALTGWAEALAALDGGPVEKEIENCEAAIAKHGEALQADPAFRTALVGRDAVQVRLSWLRPRTEAASLLDEAAKDLALVLAANDADAWAHQVMGRARYALAERAAQGWEPTLLEAALANFRRAAELRKDEPDYRNDIGDALRAQAKFAEALQSYQSVPQEAGRAYARALVGVGLTQLGRTDAALQRTMETVGKWVADGRVHFGDAIRLDPGNYIAHRGLGAILGRLAELHPKTAGELLEEAGYHLQEALKARPGDAVTLTGLGDLYRAQAALPDIGSDSRWTLLGKASEQYAAAIAALPDHFAAWLGSARTAVALSGIAARRDMLAKAVEHYEQALAARPKHAAARKELEEVRKRLEQERPTAAQA
ncbi:MAG TPA: hypothetical protein VGS58_10735, partial [Candidatus Sulfopaludibacter sp.]|nr:hypothetical protein [Candidatus Sulfopaludibacter sp.]